MLAIQTNRVRTIAGERPQASNRVNRGGSWNNNARNCRSANRNRNTPTNRNNNLGFRVALSSARGVDSLWAEQAAFPSRHGGQKLQFGRLVLVAIGEDSRRPFFHPLRDASRALPGN